MADSQVKIEFGTSGSPQAIAAAQKTGAAVGEANKTAATTAKAAGEAQKQAAQAASGAMNQLQSSMMTFMSWAVAMKFVMDGLKSTMADEAAFVRSTGTMRSMGLETAAATQRLRDFGAEMQAAAAIADDKVFPAFTRLLTATRNIAAAEYATELAMKFAVAAQTEQTQVVDTLVQALAGRDMMLKRLVQTEGMAVDQTTTMTQMLDFMERKIKASGDAANTSEMRFKRLGMTIADVGEVIGEKVMWAFVRLEFAIGSVINFLRALGTTGMAVGSALLSSFSGIAGFMMTLSREGPVKAFQYAIDFVKQQTEITKNLVSETWKDFGDEQARMLEAWGIRVSKAALEVTRARPGDLGGGGGDGEAAALDRQAMVRLQYRTGDLQAAMDQQLSLREIELFGMIDRVKIWEQEAAAREAALEKQLRLQEEFGKAAGLIMGNSINGMTNLWGDYFDKIAAGEQVKTNMFAASGKLMLAMLLDQVREYLQTEAMKHATYAGALWAGSIFNPLLIPAALGETAVAAALGVGAVATGVGSSMLTPRGAETVMPVEVMNPPGGGGTGGGYGRGYGGARGGETITSSQVTIYYNPTMVVSGNVYGMDDFRELVMQFFRDYSYIRGTDLAPIGG